MLCVYIYYRYINKLFHVTVCEQEKHCMMQLVLEKQKLIHIYIYIFFFVCVLIAAYLNKYMQIGAGLDVQR